VLDVSAVFLREKDIVPPEIPPVITVLLLAHPAIAPFVKDIGDVAVC